MIKSKLDSYLDLCTQVYDLSKPKSPENAYAFYRSYVISAKGHVLEPMCGTGRFLLRLIEEGFNVHGFDASKYMLDVLRVKATSRNLKPEVWHGFVEDFRQPEKYGLIFIPTGSFGLIIDLESAKEALTTFYEHLKDDGILVFETKIKTLKAVPNQFGFWRGSVWPRDDGKMIISNTLDLSISDNVLTSTCKYELVDDNQIIQTEIENIKVRLYDLDQIEGMLKDVGFNHVRMVKAYDKSQIPNENDNVIVYECKKQPHVSD